MRRSALYLAAFAVFASAIAATLLLPLNEHSRRESPDGTFVAIARTQLFYSLVPAMPGQGSDKPGHITVYRGSQSCGSAWVHMVSQFYDLRWQLKSNPRRAEINLGGTWNLDTCSLEHVFGG